MMGNRFIVHPGPHVIHNIPPLTLAGFPFARKVRGKTLYGGGLRRRWLTPLGQILEWDYRHGHVEVYDARGRHVGEFDPETGEQRGNAVPGRKVDP